MKVVVPSKTLWIIQDKLSTSCRSFSGVEKLEHIVSTAQAYSFEIELFYMGKKAHPSEVGESEQIVVRAESQKIAFVLQVCLDQ